MIAFKIPARLFGESLSLVLIPEPSKIHNHWDEIQPMGERNGNVLGLAEVTHLACGRGFSAVLHPPLRLPEFLPGSLTCSSARARAHRRRENAGSRRRSLQAAGAAPLLLRVLIPGAEKPRRATQRQATGAGSSCTTCFFMITARSKALPAFHDGEKLFR